MVQSQFNARFMCRRRVYKYYFMKDGLNIGLMKGVGQKLVGKHDFRNYCKVDVTQTVDFVREIYEVDIEECQVYNHNELGDDRM